MWLVTLLPNIRVSVDLEALDRSVGVLALPVWGLERTQALLDTVTRLLLEVWLLSTIRRHGQCKYGWKSMEASMSMLRGSVSFFPLAYENPCHSWPIDGLAVRDMSSSYVGERRSDPTSGWCAAFREELLESCRGPCFVPCLSVLESEEIYRPALHPAWRVEGRWEDVVDVLRHATVVCMHVVLYAGTFAVVVGCGNFCTAPSCMLQLLKVHVGFPPLCRQRYVHTCFDVRVHANGCKA